MAATFEIRTDGEIFINGSRVFIPRDAQFIPMSFNVGVGPNGEWVPQKFSSTGSIAVDSSPLSQENMTSVFTYITVGTKQRVETIKEYVTGSAAGAAAKLTTLTWNLDGTIASSSTTDTTV